VISIDGLQAVVKQLSHFDVERMRTEMLRQGAHDIEATLRVLVASPAEPGDTRRPRGAVATSRAISHRINGHFAALGAVSSVALMTELGITAKPPEPFPRAAVRQSGPVVAEGIGNMFVQRVSEIQND
jgi:hypothetical protein